MSPRDSAEWAGLTPLLFSCAKTVFESHLFQPKGLLFERKQIPQIVVIVRIQRKTMEPLEQTTVPWAQGVGRSNRPAPTKLNNFVKLNFFPTCLPSRVGQPHRTAIVVQSALFIPLAEITSGLQGDDDTPAGIPSRQPRR